ncbi:MAG: hypothetical protein ABI824_01165 [Acidobacteriota bacterium]
MRTLLLAVFASTLVVAQDYKGPVPPKTDVPYLLHASNLIETEVQDAQQDSKKNEATFWIDGTNSKARTPLAEPIFIIRAVNLKPEKFELYKFSVKKDRREVTIKDRPGRGDGPLHLSVTKVGRDLWKIEASEVLENGQYSLSPQGANKVFAFEVY